MTQGLAPEIAHVASVKPRNPAPVAATRAQRPRQLTSGADSSTSATTRPTGRKTSEKIIPRPRTRPAARAEPRAGPPGLPQARAKAEVESRGKAVSAVGWKR